MRVAIDTGGTFTDCVLLADGELRVLKLFSTPADPSLAVLDGLKRMGAGEALNVRHGTTVGTNTMLERTGARVAFVTTAGFEDTIAIGRQTRSRLYDWFAPQPVCLVPKELRFGVRERVSAEGEILLAPSDEELTALAENVRGSGAEAVAISLLFSFANPETERRIEAVLLGLGLSVSASHRILPEFREYERASTTVVNAYLAPRMERYLDRLEERVSAQHPGGRVDVMQSSGGIVPARVAAREPVRTVLSGPAGGVVGACRVAHWAGFERIVGFDMGGTSTDVFLADASAGGAQLTRESVVAGVPIGVPMLDIHTAGAGGGSIARFDAGGMLRVGPESAGAEPGPICFGRGTRATVTDAQVPAGKAGPGELSGRRHSAGPRAHGTNAARAEGFIGNGGGVCGRRSARRGDGDGKGNPGDLHRARPRPARVHAGGIRRRRAAARLLPGAFVAHPHRFDSRHAGRAFGGGNFACRFGAGLFAHRDAARRCDGRPGDLFAELEERGRSEFAAEGLEGAARRPWTCAIAARDTS